MFYFTGVRWGNSERPFVVRHSRQGRARLGLARLRGGARARADQVRRPTSASGRRTRARTASIAQILKDRGVATGTIGVEERVRFFIFDGVQDRSAGAATSSAPMPVTAGCRMIKSPAEIALMQRANDITLAAYKAAFATLREGMTQGELRDNIARRVRARSARASDGALGELRQVHRVPARQHRSRSGCKEGDIVLIDDGCTVDGYQSDITRTTVFGKPTQRQTRRLEPREARAGRGVRRGAGRRAVRSRSTPPRAR